MVLGLNAFVFDIDRPWMLLLKAGRLFICRCIDSRGELREFFYPFHQGVTDGAEPFDLLQLFLKHISQVFDGLFLKCDFSFNFLQPHGSR